MVLTSGMLPESETHAVLTLSTYSKVTQGKLDDDGHSSTSLIGNAAGNEQTELSPIKETCW